MQINTLLESIEKLEKLVEHGSQTFQNWHNSMDEIEENAKKLELNPFNIQLDFFYQMKEECMIMMTKQKRKAFTYEGRLSNHTKEKTDFPKNMDQFNKWISSMPCNRMQLFKEAQDLMRSKIESSSKKVLNICEMIDCGQKDVEDLDGRIKDLRKKMAGIESMTENPRLFAIESMIPENVTHVFSELDKWNEMYESLKEILGHWEVKTDKLEDYMIKYKATVYKNIDEKLID